MKSLFDALPVKEDFVATGNQDKEKPGFQQVHIQGVGAMEDGFSGQQPARSIIDAEMARLVVIRIGSNDIDSQFSTYRAR